MITLKSWLRNAQITLQDNGIGSAQIDAELILSSVLRQDRAFIYAHPDEILTHQQETKANELIKRRLNNEPMAYVLGHKEFYGLRFKTDKRALIPRGESEPIVDAALDWLKNKQDAQIVADIGTGSGAILLAVAKNAPQHHFIGTDVSQEAIDLAQENAYTHKILAAKFIPGNLASPLISQGYKNKINLLLTNLPYIPSPLLVSLSPDITYHEPDIALDGGSDGLELYRQLFPQLKQLMASGGLILAEHEDDHGKFMRQLAKTHFPTADIKTLQDHSGLDRLLYCQLA